MKKIKKIVFISMKGGSKDFLFILLVDMDSYKPCLYYTWHFFMITEVAETVLQRSVELERFLVNSESFKIKLSYEFVDDNGQHNIMNR